MKWVALFVMSVCCFAGEATLHMEQRGTDTILYITGGVTNVQYQIWTPANGNPAAVEQWYYWRHAYSRDHVSQPGYAEILVTSTNTPWRTNGFFQIRGVLPD